MAANMALTAISRLFLSAAVTLTVACRPSAAVLRPDVAAVDSAAVPPLEYQVQYNAGDTGTLTVSLRARALGRAPGQIVLALSDWGEWTKAREPYVRGLQVDGTALTFDSEGRLTVPRALAEDGELVATYQLLLRDFASAAHLERRLLPYRDGAHVFGFAKNTLAELVVDGRPIQRPSLVSIEAAPDEAIFTGWGGHSTGRQTAKASAEFPTENGVFAIGRIVGLATRS